MRVDAFGVVNRSLFFLRDTAASRFEEEISNLRAKYALLDDVELTAKCRSALEGKFDSHAEPSSLLRRAILRLTGRPADDSTMDLVALGVEVFRRAPADLPAGSALYSHQVRTAAALTTGTLVEMDTGEGKTYAILPAAFALCCTRRRVYIVCASEYLAWRDATRTAAFWDRAGVSVGLAAQSTSESEWDARVIYTTLDRLIFKAMRDTLLTEPPTHPLTYNALLLDEADAILLDQAAQPYAITQPMQASTYDWSTAFAFCEQLEEIKDIAVDRTYLIASLTEKGEAALRAQNADASPAQYLLLRHAVETAFIATKVVHEDVDFVAEGNRVHPVNRLSGRIERNITPPWIIPLEWQRGLPARPVSIELNTRSASSFISEFEQISGTSGTILEDGIEFLLSYSLLPMRVEPRYRRHDGEQTPLVYRTKREAHNAIVERATESHARRRPVLVGCQTPGDAEQLVARIRQAVPNARISLLTGRDDRHTADVFEAAGQVDSIVVATQVAGRGVDIRLSEEARANGGLDLICAGHSLQRRHDRQFLGRAGRQGDPYTSTFYCSLDDDLLVLYGSHRIKNIMEHLGMEEGVPIESKMVRNALYRAQREQTYRRFISRRANQFLAQNEREIYAGISEWFLRLQSSRPEHGREIDDELLEDVASRFVELRTSIIDEDCKVLDARLAASLAQSLAGVAGADRPPFITARELEEHTPDNAKKLIKDALLKELRRRVTAHATACQLNNRETEVQDVVLQIDGLLDACPEAETEAGDIEREMVTVDESHQQQLAGIETALRAVATNDSDPRFPRLTTARKIADLCAAVRADAAGGKAVDVAPLRAAFRETLDVDSNTYWRIRRLLMVRTIRQIVYWSLQWTWLECLGERDRIRDRYAQGDLSAYDYYRAVADRSREKWDELAQAIPEKIVANLMQSDRPESLDQLFLLEDHADFSHPEPRLAPLVWSSRTDAQQQQKESDRDLVDRFITRSEPKLAKPMTASLLRRLLDDFLRDHPLESLASPRQIQSALESWSVREVENGVESRRRKLRRRWLGDFLTFLRDQRLISALPTLRHRLISLRSRLARRVKNVHTMLPLSIGALVIGAIALLVWKGDIGPARILPPFLSWGDAWITAGTIARGNPIAPAAAALVLASIATWAIWPAQTQRVHPSALGYLLSLFISGGVAFMMFAEPASAGWIAMIFGMAKIAGAVFLTLVLRRLILLVISQASFDLMSVWLLYAAIFAVLPRVIAVRQWQEPAIAAVLVAACAAWAYVTRVEVEVVAVRLGSTGDRLPSEQLTTSIEVQGHADFPPYLLALVSAWAVAEFIVTTVHGKLSPALTIAVPAVTYFAVATLWTANVLGNRLALGSWKTRLNERHQLMVGFDSDAAMAKRLDGLRQRMLIKQTLWLAVAVTATVLLLPRAVGPIPVATGLFVVSAAAFIAFEGQRFLRQLRSLSLGGVYNASNNFDVNAIPEPEEELDFWDRVRRVTKTRLAITIGVISLILKFAGVIMAAWKLVHGGK